MTGQGPWFCLLSAILWQDPHGDTLLTVVITGLLLSGLLLGHLMGKNNCSYVETLSSKVQSSCQIALESSNYITTEEVSYFLSLLGQLCALMPKYF